VTVNANPEDTEMAMNKSEDAATYVVRSGDTLYDIAAQFNVNVKQLMDWNNIDSPTSLRPGQRLVLSD
jgi:LysM repeat protein